MINIDYTEKMKKLGPIPEDMRTFWIRDDLARVEAKMPYCLQCIKEGKEIVAALDDMAQIIGPRVKIVPDDDLEIAKALTTSAAVLVDAEQILNIDGNLPVSGTAMDGKARREQDYVVATGRDPYEAFVALTVLEKAAEVQVLAEALGGVNPIPERIARKERREYLNKYSKAGRQRREKEFQETVDAQQETADAQRETADAQREITNSENLIEEFNERNNLVEYGKKLIEKKLVQGTWGNLSVVLDDGTMLVTPSGLDYDSLGPEDMVKVDLESLDYDKSGNKPTTEMGLHAGIYNNRPDIGAIIHTHSKYCSVFAACGFPIDVTDESLAKEISGEVIHIADYGASGSEILINNVVKALGGVENPETDVFQALLHGRKGCLMSNHGMIACGENLDSAMEVALAMEEAARQQINRRLSKLVESQIERAEEGETENQKEDSQELQNPLMIIDTREEDKN